MSLRPPAAANITLPRAKQQGRPPETLTGELYSNKLSTFLVGIRWLWVMVLLNMACGLHVHVVDEILYVIKILPNKWELE